MIAGLYAWCPWASSFSKWNVLIDMRKCAVAEIQSLSLYGECAGTNGRRFKAQPGENAGAGIPGDDTKPQLVFCKPAHIDAIMPPRPRVGLIDTELDHARIINKSGRGHAVVETDIAGAIPAAQAEMTVEGGHDQLCIAF